MGFFIVQLQNYQSEAHYAAKLKNRADMNLQPNECDQFYRIWCPLLSYVNNQAKLINEFPSQLETSSINQHFGDKIIFDSLLNSYRVSFGSGIRKDLNNQLRHAQELRGVVTTLDATDQTQAIINGNQKILIAFRKWLAKEGLSEKMQHEHHTNVRIFVNDRLSSAMPSRSLLNVNISEVLVITQ